MPPLLLDRRTLLIGSAASTLLAACATRPAMSPPPPIVFMHGNGDSAALWTTTLWRFESNGWPRERLFPLHMPWPLARDNDSQPQPGRSSTAESMAYLSAEVDKALAATGASQVILIANSRGGNAVRNYIQNGGGAAKVSHAILGGTPNHGVFADPSRSPNGEFNGGGVFLTGLNAPKGPNGDEVTPGLKWLTIRSDSNDKYAQPDGVWIGAPGTPTHVAFDGPALKGAENVVIAGIDHRETSYGRLAFEQMFRFITGRPPVALDIVPEAASVVLDGEVDGHFLYTVQGVVPSNQPLVGASVEVYAVDPASGMRLGSALLRRTVGADGRWGPLRTDARTCLEFVVAAPGYATTHIYRAPFARSSAIVHLRPEKLLGADAEAGAVVVLSRPRGYIGVPRDRSSLDGQSPAPGIPPGTAGMSSSKLRLADAGGRAIVGEFNDERVVGRTWPVANNEISYLELTY